MHKKSLSFAKSFKSISRFDQFKDKLNQISELLSKKSEEDNVVGWTIVIEFQTEDF